MLSILILSVSGVVNLFLGFGKAKGQLQPIAILFFLAGLVGLVWGQGIEVLPANFTTGMLSFSHLSVGFSAVVILSAIMVCFLATEFLKRPIAQPAEYFSIMLFSAVGALMMISYEHLIMLFLGLETLSIGMYVLAGSEKRSERSNEAALKYFLMGAFATGFLLFGFALIYGATGSFTLEGIRHYVDQTGTDGSPMLYIGLLLVLVGLLFKISAVPFHFWAADVYEGTPTLFTAFMSTVVKTAGFAAIYKILGASFANLQPWWSVLILVVAALSLIIGNLTACVQTSFKRTMAFSSISHAGYMLIAVAALQTQSDVALLTYSFAYSMATLLAFGVCIQGENGTGGRDDFDAFNGLYKSNPSLALAGLLAMLSLAGIPLTGGFTGKLLVFMSGFQAGFVPILILAALASATGIYYYLKPVMAMFFRAPIESRTITVEPATHIVLGLCAALILIIGLFPQQVWGIF
jgi:NADH-quinone oxidoreductase subunit N